MVTFLPRRYSASIFPLEPEKGLHFDLAEAMLSVHVLTPSNGDACALRGCEDHCIKLHGVQGKRILRAAHATNHLEL
eukprot:4674376-Amphidinium_carterae.1